jgi:hypothetical protein
MSSVRRNFVRDKLTITNPGSQSDAGELGQKSQGNRVASMGSRREFGCPRRGNDEDKRHSDAGNDSGYQDRCEVDCGCLKYDTNGTECACNPNTFDSTVAIGKPTGQKATEE